MIIKGVYPAIVTPMKRDGYRLEHKINYDIMPNYLEFLAKNGVSGFVLCGCTGADALLENDEQINYIKNCKKIIEDLSKKYGELLIIAGDGSNSTKHAVELAKRVEGETGVMHHLQISPYKVKPTKEGIFEHYKQVAKGIEGKIIAYSVNGRTGGNGILPETFLKMVESYPKRIVAIKEATGGKNSEGIGYNVLRAKKTMELLKESCFDSIATVLSGDDDATLDMMKYGATGSISVAGNASPKLVSNMVLAQLNRDYEKAKNYHNKLKPLMDIIFTENNPQDIMHVLNYMGLDVGVPRLPLGESSIDTQKKISDLVKTMNLYVK
jgi:4-hydroxy-tetrahydrodipicolinate synthase